MKKLLPMLLFALLSLSALSALAEEPFWTSDLEAAKATAAKEGKDILILFTGSDWCPACKALDKAVLSTPEFKTETAKKYVPVLLDFPKEGVPANLKAQNEGMASEIGLSGVPSVVLMDAKGRIYAVQRGYEDSITPDSFAKKLETYENSRKKRDLFFEAAGKAQGEEKARNLNNGLTSLLESGVFECWTNYGYDAEVAEAVKCDPQNKLHVKAVWEYRRYVNISRLLVMKNDFAGAIAPLDEYLKQYTDEKEFSQKIMSAKAQLQVFSSNVQGCLDTLAAMVAMDPKSEMGKSAAASIVAIKAQLAADQNKPLIDDLKEESEKK